MFRRTAGWVRERSSLVGRVVLVVALVLATWPAWRVALLGSDATLEELLQLVCAPVVSAAR